MFDWRKSLADANLIWTTIGLTAAGLAGAFAAGMAVARRGFIRRIRALTNELNDVNSTLRQKEKEVEQLKFQIVEKDTAIAAAGALPKVSHPLPALADGVGIWARDADAEFMQPQERLATKPILVVANLKGGVAKTMLSANLGVYFSKRGDYPKTRNLQSKSVLLVDLDYQGSLSDLVTDGMSPKPGPRNLKTKSQTLFEGGDPFDALAHRIHPSANLPKLSLYPAEYGFDDFEAHELQRWLSGDSTDIRFNLRRMLRSKPFSDAFELTIMDTGPRLTLGSVAALAAATHLVIPTALDQRSREAAMRYLGRVSRLRKAGVCPDIKFVGIVPTLVTARNKDLLEPAATDIDAKLEEPEFEWTKSLKNYRGMMSSRLDFSFKIQEAAETTIPYLENTPIRSTFNEIGAEIESRME